MMISTAHQTSRIFLIRYLILILIFFTLSSRHSLLSYDKEEQPKCYLSATYDHLSARGSNVLKSLIPVTQTILNLLWKHSYLFIGGALCCLADEAYGALYTLSLLKSNPSISMERCYENKNHTICPNYALGEESAARVLAWDNLYSDQSDEIQDGFYKFVRPRICCHEHIFSQTWSELFQNEDFARYICLAFRNQPVCFR